MALLVVSAGDGCGLEPDLPLQLEELLSVQADNAAILAACLWCTTRSSCDKGGTHSGSGGGGGGGGGFAIFGGFTIPTTLSNMLQV
jgi:hypothetical protein